MFSTAKTGEEGKQERQRSLEKETRVVLVGITGCGKSATGNTILGEKEKKFRSSAHSKSTTTDCDAITCERFGNEMLIVDVPGFIDTEKSAEDMKKDIATCVVYAAPGIHAILFVVKIGRYSEKDRQTLQEFIKVFGKDSMKYVIVIFTGLDDLEDEGSNIDEFVLNATSELRNFLSSVSNRYIAVCNKKKPEENDVFVQTLQRKIKELIHANGGSIYTNEMLKKVQEELKKAGEKEGSNDYNSIKARVVACIVASTATGAAGGTVVAGPVGTAAGAVLGIITGVIASTLLKKL